MEATRHEKEEQIVLDFIDIEILDGTQDFGNLRHTVKPV